MQYRSSNASLFSLLTLLVAFLLATLFFTKYIKTCNLNTVMKIKKQIDNWHLNLTPPEKLTFLSPYGGTWSNGKSNCGCNIGKPLPLIISSNPKDVSAIKIRRRLQYEQHRKR
ncbi:hypothetical protein chiPu_0013902 [Chiloscyllium punctatum]|uniref:Uncharacterized protein n=2 Tax=Chiloscyllium punctatum TaxID=137246 RepID=A0A401SYE3_CHIPU|nr:hypothetical protein [Chiloscyllium punctatum]